MDGERIGKNASNECIDDVTLSFESIVRTRVSQMKVVNFKNT